MTQRHSYHIHPVSGTCIPINILERIASELQGQLVGTVVFTDVRAKAKQLKLLSDGFGVAIEHYDKVRVMAGWLESVADLYPDATMAQLRSCMSEREFAWAD